VHAHLQISSSLTTLVDAMRRENARNLHARSHVAPGITVAGRIDLVRRLDTNELSIVDFKSTARAQDEDVTRDQLHVYAVGYEELTGERANLIELLNLDEEGGRGLEVVAKLQTRTTQWALSSLS
jgi:hypothetical protein